MTFPARAGVLQYLMNGASSDSTCFARKRRRTFASRERPVAGLKPGSTAVNRRCGVSRANASTVARMHCFAVA